MTKQNINNLLTGNKRLVNNTSIRKIKILEPIYYSEQFGGAITKREAAIEGVHTDFVYIKKGTILTSYEPGNILSIDFETSDGSNIRLNAGWGPRKYQLIK